ncbi:aldehyde dehydrogenase family protein [Paenarthrobacter nitroguajacolicus]|uniref:aldehyde dehydrogenase family protein n=1 Tax=Paenarthrobacter nitroguajacolicus TaxID=211146 RepID=UPI0028633120|nr:aldehyde dehydrogenase family protein [Paenarthrobacter nitroguajacolicus]MDR6637063.1 betaine-aldehyde dehydrogenase [Paenarthrobacter nitroguajacolicus]
MPALTEFSNLLFLDGEWTPSAGGFLTTFNPATGDAIAEIAAADATDVDRAVTAATRALTGPWAAVPPSEKGRLLNRLADLVERDKEQLGRLESWEMGGLFGLEQQLFVPNLISTLRYFAGWADKVNGETLPNDGYMGRPTFAYTRREPVGVIAAIVPWNAPLMILGWKLAPALATGNVVIVKPAEEASLAILHLAGLAAEAGFPAGVLQVLPGKGAIAGEALSTHPGVHKVSFTGSPEVGRRILRNSAETFKRTTLELGGKSPNIIFEDANLEAAIQGAAMGIFVNSGEVCAAGSRIFVHRSVHGAVLDGLAGAAAAQVLGDPMDPDTTMGPLVNSAQRDRVLAYIAKGAEEGAALISGGGVPAGPGYFVQPTIFAGSNDMTIAREEIFGPVATVVPFDNDADVIRMANDNQYGLAATVWTNDLNRAHQISAALHAGAVGVNGWSPLAPQLPWGGLKASGIGRELGYEGILANTEAKTVTIIL